MLFLEQPRMQVIPVVDSKHPGIVAAAQDHLEFLGTNPLSLPERMEVGSWSCC